MTVGVFKSQVVSRINLYRKDYGHVMNVYGLFVHFDYIKDGKN